MGKFKKIGILLVPFVLILSLFGMNVSTVQAYEPPTKADYGDGTGGGKAGGLNPRDLWGKPKRG